MATRQTGPGPEASKWAGGSSGTRDDPLCLPGGHPDRTQGPPSLPPPPQPRLWTGCSVPLPLCVGHRARAGAPSSGATPSVCFSQGHVGVRCLQDGNPPRWKMPGGVPGTGIPSLHLGRQPVGQGQGQGRRMPPLARPSRQMEVTDLSARTGTREKDVQAH